MKKILSILLSVLMFGILSSSACSGNKSAKESKQLTALIVTGQSTKYHNWQQSTPMLKKMLEDTKLFQVDVIISPAAGDDMQTFSPEFQKYDVIVLNYNGDMWSQSTQVDFENYVKNGGGIVVFHASNNAFRDWEAYNRIIGLGGWGGRDQSAGSYFYWNDGKMVSENVEGKSGHHGKQTEFMVNTRAPEHPIMKGLPETWLHAQDELYCYMRGPGENMEVLATGFSEKETGGSGREEPLLLTILYGKGHVFHTMLGHVNSTQNTAPQCAGFVVTFQRGSEWAATGNVTQALPTIFPDTETTVLLNQYDVPSIE